jgi:hypothetical protein
MSGGAATACPPPLWPLRDCGAGVCGGNGSCVCFAGWGSLHDYTGPAEAAVGACDQGLRWGYGSVVTLLAVWSVALARAVWLLLRMLRSGAARRAPPAWRVVSTLVLQATGWTIFAALKVADTQRFRLGASWALTACYIFAMVSAYVHFGFIMHAYFVYQAKSTELVASTALRHCSELSRSESESVLLRLARPLSARVTRPRAVLIAALGLLSLTPPILAMLEPARAQLFGALQLQLTLAFVTSAFLLALDPLMRWAIRDFRAMLASLPIGVDSSEVTALIKRTTTLRRLFGLLTLNVVVVQSLFTFVPLLRNNVGPLFVLSMICSGIGCHQVMNIFGHSVSKVQPSFNKKKGEAAAKAAAAPEAAEATTTTKTTTTATRP